MKKGPVGGTLKVLSEEDIHRIHNASLRLLEKHGILSESELVINIFEKEGVKVDRESRIVHISAEMLDDALESAPKSFPIHGRDPAMTIQVELGQVYFGMGGTSEPYFWDYETKKPRSPTKSDMVSNTRIAQALPNVDFVMALCSARDMPTHQNFLHEYDAIFRNSAKPVVISVLGQRHTELILEMAASVSGTEEELRQNPWIMAYVTPISPLEFSYLNEGLITAAENDIPILYGVGPMMGATSPATVVGNLAQGNAEVLFGLVLSQIVKPGIPFIYSPHTPAMDMKTAQCTYGSAEQAVGRVASAQLARLYGLPTFNTGGGVEAKLPNAQAAAEAMMGMLLNGLSGVTLTQTMGTLASGLYGAPEMLVICDEIAHMVKRVLRGISVTEDTLALEVIREVGHGGHFLDHDHTARHFREELFFPSLFERMSVEQWIDRGAKSTLEVAHEKVAEILSKTKPIKLPEGAGAALEQTLQNALSEIEMS